MIHPAAGQGLAALGRRLAGEVLVPGSAGYESMRKPVHPRFDHIRPQAITLAPAAATWPRCLPSPGSQTLLDPVEPGGGLKRSGGCRRGRGKRLPSRLQQVGVSGVR
jgi:hypothetical protein